MNERRKKIRKVYKKKSKLLLSRVFLYLCVLALIVWILAPYMWLIISSISSQQELTAKPPHWIPEEPTLERYISLVLGRGFGQQTMQAMQGFRRSLLNSLIIAGSTTIICLIVGTMAAYAFTRFSFPGRRHMLLGTLITQMLPVMGIIIPLYIIMRLLNLIDQHLGLVMLYTGLLLSPVIWLMRGYMGGIPIELEEAAMIDGCSRVKALIKIIVPMCGPGLVATGIFTFLAVWNEFFMALIFTATNARTVTVAITGFSTSFGIDYGLMTTGGVVGSLPPILIAIIFQRYIVTGLTAGALKM